MLKTGSIFFLFVQSLLCYAPYCVSQHRQEVRLIQVDSGWAKNSVNTVAFRKNSLDTWRNEQYIAYYDNSAHVVIGKRILNESQWELTQLPYSGNTRDAHNSISIMLDGDGYIHLAWDHHNSKLRYARSIAPSTLVFHEEQMTGLEESSVTYPEFQRLRNGNLLFLYRSGESGKGSMIINRYNTKLRQWVQLHNNVISGEGLRSAYWQTHIDRKGTLHLSWVWRESPDVASNHDMCYARSEDGGKTWCKSDGSKYTLPITKDNAEYAYRIPEGSELINQTSMSADKRGNPFIASYWRDENSQIPQYKIIYLNKHQWKLLPLNFRETPFSLTGAGTKSIPIARPQIAVSGRNRYASLILLFRDEERESKVSALHIVKLKKKDYHIADLTTFSVGSWEPAFDTKLWERKKALHVFVQKVEQADAEGISQSRPTMIYVLEYIP